MKIKRIIAILGISALLILYIAAFISALLTSPSAPELFKACLYATIVVPVMFYGYILVYKVLKQRAEDNKREFEEALAKGAADMADDNEADNDEPSDEMQ